MRVLLLALLLLGSIPAIVFAQSGINLHWDDCYAGAFAVDKTDSCTAPGIRRDALILSVELSPGDVIADINGAQGTIEIEFDDVVQPDYWRLETGGCYGGGLIPDLLVGSSNAPFSCPEPWSQVGGVAGGVLFESFVSCNNRARIRWLMAVPGTVTLSSAIGLEWYMVKLNFVRNGSANCTGCGVAACFVATEIRLTKPAGTPGGDIFLTNPAQNQHASWQGAGNLGCPATDHFPPCPTPIQSRTWGSVKGLYR